jgi:hypothetical protein
MENKELKQPPASGGSPLNDGLYTGDILDGLASIRHAFLRANLKVPTTILLESHDEGMRFLSAIRQKGNWFAEPGSPDLGKAITMSDGSVYMECTVMRIAVRWPANKLATRDGKWTWV